VRHKAIRAAFAVCVAALGAVAGLSWSRGIDSGLQDRYSRGLRLVAGTDAGLDDAVLEARSGLLGHYDSIAHRVAELRRLHDRLESVPDFFSSSARAEIRASLARSRRLFERKEGLVEEFKTAHAVLRNSQHFFPVAANELAEEVGASPEGRELADRIGDLLGDVLLFHLVTDRDLLPRIEVRIEAVRASATGPHAAAVAVLVSHARVILDRKPRVDDLVARIVALPTAARARDLEDVWSRRHGEAVADASNRQAAFLLLALAALALGAADVILRLRASARAVGAAKEDLQRALDALRVEKEKEKELVELKSRFVTMASHEFRHPLSVILSSTDLLEAYGESWPAEKRREHFVRIQTAVKGMAQMLDQVLVVGKAQAGMLEFRPAAVDLEAFCRGLVDEVQKNAGNGHRVAFSAHGEWGRVSMDENLLRHIFTNLLSNAVKYSPDGGTVHFDVFSEDSLAIFEIRDEGIGIPAEDLPRLFEIFHRGRNVGSISGTGLGLAIVKRGVDLHGGTIRVLSGLGKGTRFIVKIPVEPSQ